MYQVLRQLSTVVIRFTTWQLKALQVGNFSVYNYSDLCTVLFRELILDREQAFSTECTICEIQLGGPVKQRNAYKRQ